MLSQKQKLIKSLTMPVAIFVCMVFFMGDFFFLPSLASSGLEDVVYGTARFASSERISGDSGPRIDYEAVMAVKKDGESKLISLCNDLTGKIWIFLLAAYLFLMLFNLFYDFGLSDRLRWFWEGLYTALAISAWYAFDECSQNLWFPLYVLKLGTIIYLVYLYLFYRKKEIQMDF